MEIYARILQSSKYFGQGKDGDPFKVELQPDPAGYVWSGSNNSYRTEDLEFFYISKQTGEFTPQPIVNRSSLGELQMCLEDMKNYCSTILQGELGQKDWLYEQRDAEWFILMTEIMSLVPAKRPTCDMCGCHAGYCECE